MLFLIVDSFFKVFLGPLYGFTDRSDEELTGNRMRERGSDMQPRDPEAGSQTQVCCSEDTASVHE